MKPTLGQCDVCGCSVPQSSEPVTISGWYNGHYFRWDASRLRLLSVRCEQHREDEEVTP